MKIVIIGSGNLAHSLAFAISSKNYNLQICSRNLEKAEELAEKVNAGFSSIEQMDTDANFYFLAVSDNAIEKVVNIMKPVKGILLHCSGAANINIFGSKHDKFGVLYPLQTFSKNRPIDNFYNIPIFIEANNEIVKHKIEDFAKHLSKKVNYLNSRQRCSLHLAAVFVCNFSNHLFTLTFDFLEKEKIENNYLYDLVKETVNKAFESKHPFLVQTGPAVRGDFETIKKHMDLIKDNKQMSLLYNILTEQIIDYKSTIHE